MTNASPAQATTPNGNGTGPNAGTGTTSEVAPGGQPQTTAPAGANTVQMSQDALDRLMAERAERAERAAVTRLLEGLGVKSPEELGQVLTEWRTSKEAQMTELQRTQAEQAKLAETLNAATAAKTAVEQRFIKAMRQTEVLRIAQELRFIDPSEAWILVVGDGLEDKIDVDLESGKVGGVREIVKAIAEKRKHLIASDKPERRPIGTPRPGQPAQISAPTDTAAPATRVSF